MIALPETEPSRSGRVLAVDDNEQNLRLLEEHLWQWGYEVVLARDGAEAVEAFATVGPDLIVLDIMMPVMDGYEACAHIKRDPRGRHTPILMLTALTGTEDKVEALSAGADDFLNKPISRDELRTRIASLMKIRNLRKELDSSENIIGTLSSALDSRDAFSSDHAKRVAAYARALSRAIGLDSETEETIAQGALLHDIGLIGIAEQNVRHSGAAAVDQQAFEKHSAIGAAILSPLKTFAAVIPIVRGHHERLDGRGFPDGLRGDQISLEVQIVALTNRFDELRSTSESDEEGFARLEQEAFEGAFDLELLRMFRGTFAEVPPPPSSKFARVARRPSAPKARVLCVDDSASNREVIASAIHSGGFELTSASSGANALQQLAEKQIDIVLLDVMMAGQHGLDTLRLIRSNPSHEFLPVIIITTHRDDELRREAILSGADDFLRHPINRLELTTRIRSLLRIRDYHADLEATQNIICALALAIEAKDPYTRGHSQRVGDLAYTFALHVGLTEPEAVRIRVAGLLHDIGKIAVPDLLLNKKGPLSRDEFMEVIDHPVIGEEICRPLLSLDPVLKMIRHHHERYDGRGYPDGLKGDSIPFEVRLISIIDAYDALTSHRAYRSPLPHEEAVETLRREALDGKWDPSLVEAFSAMVADAPPDFAAISGAAPVLIPEFDLAVL